MRIHSHGPPGTGKTLTAEGIAELLKRPLYMVSVGELGTNPHQLETELNKILDVAHSWGAVLLLDEADVFLGACLILSPCHVALVTSLQRHASHRMFTGMHLSASFCAFWSTSRASSS